MTVFRQTGRRRTEGETGVWLSELTTIPRSKREAGRYWWWLPPVIWPDNEAVWQGILRQVLQMGGRRFVLNAPWQIALFGGDPSIVFWAGPFCNIASGHAVAQLAGMGFHGVIVSPELGAKDYQELAATSPLPLGIVLAGHWPLCVSRAISSEIELERPFESPKGEQAWVRNHDGDYWVYPNWRLDIRHQRDALIQAGFQLFVHLSEPVPKGVEMKTRPGLWNWDIELQ